MATRRMFRASGNEMKRHFVVVRYLTESDDPRQAASLLSASIDEHLQRAAAC